MITIVDYGVGNIQAMVNMFDYLGIEARASSNADEIANADQLVLPGVGAYDKAMSALVSRQLIPSLEQAAIHRKIPVLGVCLGMQLLARRSEEGSLPGLGWIAADVRRIQVPSKSALKVPHIGWADVSPTGESELFPTTEVPARFYFVHSFHVVCDDPRDVAAVTEHGATICCAVHHENIWGVQFHPEKSHRHGMRLLLAFARQGPDQ